MPELPEAETIVRSLRPGVEGRTIAAAEFLSKRVSRDDPGKLQNRRIAAVRRHGKQILFELDRGSLLVKLGMTGALLINAQAGPYTRAVLVFDDESRLLFDDIRQFGSLSLLDQPPAHLGPDPMEITADEFTARLRARNTALKGLLLDQGFVRGLGNIYADEALFRAGIHPLARSKRLSRARAAHLHAEIVKLLREAIDLRGSSISDYVDAAGEKGGFQLRHRVYRKHGLPCPHCGALLQRIVVTQRGTHFCPRCQLR